MRIISQTYHINSSVDKVWKALTDTSFIDAWGGGPSKMSPKIGFDFSLWDGEIWGKNIEVIPNRKLVQEWTEGEWEKPSIVTFDLSGSDSQTILKLTQSGYPETEHDDLEKGWEDFYLGPLKKSLE